MGNQHSLTFDQIQEMKLQSECQLTTHLRAALLRLPHPTAVTHPSPLLCSRIRRLHLIRLISASSLRQSSTLTRQSVTDDELKRLFRRFKRLDTDRSGALSVTEFLAIPELEHNPLVQRVVATFDSDGSGEVDFQEFISALSVFTTADKETKDSKFLFVYKLYDVDGDGFISNADLYHVLKAMVGNNLNDVQLQQLVDRTILQGDKNKDGKLSYEEFVDMVKETDIENKLKIEF